MNFSVLSQEHSPAQQTNSSPIFACLADIYESYRQMNEGNVATYIPELAKVNPELFGVCLATADGQLYEVGQSQHSFTIQSISKPFVYGLALADHGPEVVMKKVGVEPTGEAFNSIIFDEVHNRPYNPMVNAGAIATTALIKGQGYEARFQRILRMFEGFTGSSLKVDEAVFESEQATGHRNRAIAYLELNAGMLEGSIDEHLALYFRQCSILVTARDLAIMAATLANNGMNPLTKKRAIAPQEVTSILSVMTSCGMYDFSGEWLYRVGLPAKSGVGGGIIAVLPGQFGIGIFSPRLDAQGNSVRGIRVCEELSQRFQFHVFNSHPIAETCVSRTYTGAMVSSKRQRRTAEREILEKEGSQIVVYELKGDLYFATMEKLARNLRNSQKFVKFIILQGRQVSNISPSAFTLLSDIQQWLTNQNITVILTGFSQSICQSLKAQSWPENTIFNNIDAALEWCENYLLSKVYPNSVKKVEKLSLADMDIFNEFNQKELETISSLFNEKNYKANDFIIREGEEANSLFLLAVGSATASFKLPNSEKRKRLTTYIPGIAFGELALFDVAIHKRTADIIADSDVICYVLTFTSLEQLLTTAPDIYVKLLKTFGQTLVNTLKRATLEIRSLSV